MEGVENVRGANNLFASGKYALFADKILGQLVRLCVLVAETMITIEVVVEIVKYPQKMREFNFQTLWHQYLVDNPPDFPEVYELKLVKKDAFPFASVKEHQVMGLLNARQGLFHKISDSPIFAGNQTRFTAPKPFDCMWLIGMSSFVVIMFYKPREHKTVFVVPIDHFISIRDNSKKKSIRLEELEAIIKPIKL